MDRLITKSVNLNTGNPENTRREIMNYFEKTWEIDEKLYSQLANDEVFYHRGDPLRHVLLFYLGHTAVFFINKLFLAKIIDTRINPSFESLFAIGVDEMSWDDLDEKHYQWPKVSEVKEYRNKAKKLITDLMLSLPIQLPVTRDQPFWIIMMGIEHERIHLETSSVLIRQLPLNEVIPGRFGKVCQQSGEAPVNELLPVKGSLITLGKPLQHPLYGWDNEYGKHTEEVTDFEASKFLISNAEFLEFIDDGAYKNQTYWTEEGWHWRNFKNAEMPLFWRKNGDEYRLRLVAEEIPMPWNWPVEVNYLEAKAFCNWKTAKTGKTFRLPTEAEWYCLADQCNVPDQPDWKVAPGNINLEHYSSPCPVNTFKMGNFYDVIGNVWQWTETPITGFAGFRVHPMYDDFSTPTFDGKHNLIKGGSWISTGNEATYHARYAFRRHFYQHAGFRLVMSESPLIINIDEYETDNEVANSCEEMWGQNDESNFSVLLSGEIKKLIDQPHNKKLLDLNADTGRLAFELASDFNKITAIDSSARFIRMPIQLQQKGFMRYISVDEGELLNYREIVLSDLKAATGRDKILFMQDNANNLKPIYSNYDVIIAANVLEELTCPILFLQKINERLNDKGILVIASTYDWNSTGIKREHWPGGFKKDGEPLTSFEGIKEILSVNFNLISKPFNLNRIQPKSTRYSEIKLVEVSYWQKK